jgi:hypothetical protein
MAATTRAESRPSFRAFYRDAFLDEHRHPANVALHVAGTLASTAWIPLTLLSPWPWLVVLWPIVHAAPGLLGHRLFERNEAVGDVRVTRTDFPPHWFIGANHWMALDVLRGKLRWDRRGA